MLVLAKPSTGHIWWAFEQIDVALDLREGFYNYLKLSFAYLIWAHCTVRQNGPIIVVSKIVTCCSFWTFLSFKKLEGDRLGVT